ncbi:unnamed protein product [Amoebophrya sp. A120]|nr:unnamed protein product [Amoebophrya sp. A120]|eukprot:GSA120T00025154001.1
MASKINPGGVGYAHRRLMKEGDKLKQTPCTLVADGVWVDPEQFALLPKPGSSSAAEADGQYRVTAYIQGPLSTEWECGVFEVELLVPRTYPMEPLEARFSDPIFHPNVDTDGKICQRLISDMWSPTHNLESVLQTMRSVLSDPKENISFDDAMDATDTANSTGMQGASTSANASTARPATAPTAQQISAMNPDDGSSGRPRKLYHYTTHSTAKKIKESLVLLPSVSGAYGPGIYCTAVHPAFVTKDQVLANNYGSARGGGYADFVVELDVETIVRGGTHRFERKNGGLSGGVNVHRGRDIWMAVTPDHAKNAPSRIAGVVAAGAADWQQQNLLRLNRDNCVIAPFHIFASCEVNEEASALLRSSWTTSGRGTWPFPRTKPSPTKASWGSWRTRTLPEPNTRRHGF